MDNYFSKHYAQLNGIDPNNSESISDWYESNLEYYSKQLDGIFDESEISKKIIDLGCGIGGLLKYLLHKGASNICGVDFSSEQIEICKKYVTNSVVHDDIFNNLLNEETYDVVFILDVIEHIKKGKQIELFDLLFKKLNYGGKVIIRTPNMASISGLKSRYIDITHEIGYTEESIKQVLLIAGFQDVEVRNEYIGRKRLIVINTINWIIKKIYNIIPPKIVTSNLMVIARK